MIPFFRKIRKQFADENRPFKYLRYAIGEIVLVVIGILIALQINNWNENQIRDGERITLLQNLRLDALATKSSMESLIGIRKDILKKRRRSLALAAIKDPHTPLDTIRNLITWAEVKSVEKWPILTTYEAALSSGEIELLRNRELLQSYNTLNIRNEQRLKLADYHFQNELLFGIRDLKKIVGSGELFFKQGPSSDLDEAAQAALRKVYYDPETYATVATEFDIWTNQVNILSRIAEINDTILAVLNRELKQELP